MLDHPYQSNIEDFSPLRVRGFGVLRLLFALCLITDAALFQKLALAGPLKESPPSPVWVKTDKPDYAPTEIVLITGGGFLPHERVALEVFHVGYLDENGIAVEFPPGSTDPNVGMSHGQWTARADANGDLQTEWTVCADVCAGAWLELRARGRITRKSAVWRFTDAVSPISLATCPQSVSQDFDTLANTGTPTWTNGDTPLQGWYAARGSVASIAYTPSAGTSLSIGLYSYGTGADTDRAMGAISGNTAADTMRFGARFKNDTGHVITALTINFIGEQWRRSGSGAPQSLTFDYKVNALSITDAGFIPDSNLDFAAPQSSGPAGALDGNNSANRTAKSDTFNVMVLPGQEIWLRWSKAGTDSHGLAVDELSITPILSRLVALSESFGAGTGLPTGWTTTGWTIGTATPSSGYPAASGGSNATSNNSLNRSLTTLVSDFTGLSDGVLIFGLIKSSASFTRDLLIEVSTDDFAGIPVFTQTIANLDIPLTWTLKTINLSTSIDNASSVKVRFSLPGTGSGTSNIKIDDIALTGAFPKLTTSESGPTTFCQGGSVILTANRAGLNYQWYKDESPIAGATSQSYSAIASGSYKVGLSCGGQFDSDPITVTVNTVASVTDPPNQSIECGMDAIFSVVGADSPQMSHQWQEDAGAGWNDVADGGIYHGATSSVLTLTKPPLYSSGRKYRCVVIGGCPLSTATSNAAELTVLDTTPPVISVAGDNPTSIQRHASYADEGATASDACDGSVSVTPSGSVDVNTLGGYIITYTSSDSHGNAAIATRTVNVVDVNPQPLPYKEDFAGLSHASTTYPDGWGGWKIGTTSGMTFRTAVSISDENLHSGSSASTTEGGVHNYDGKIGFLSTSSTDASVVLALDTSGFHVVTVGFDVMTIRNPHDGGSNTRINQVDLQYRVGVSGSFKSVSGNVSGVYENSNATQTGAGVTTPQNLQAQSWMLPADCDNQPVVEIRWVQRDTASTGGSRPSFAIDNVCATGNTLVRLLESVGAAAPATSGFPSIANYEIANNFDNDDLTMSGTGDVRSTGVSGGYQSASGGANVFLLDIIGSEFQIAGINTSDLTSLTLAFGLHKQSTAGTGTDLAVEVSADGIAYTALQIPELPSGAGTGIWYHLTVNGTIPSTQNLHIRFSKISTGAESSAYRLDDIKLTGTMQPTVSISADPSGPICPGTSVMLTATPTNAGLSPSFQWMLNDSIIEGASGSTYFSSALVHGDKLSCVVTTADPCRVIQGTSTPSVITGDTVKPVLVGVGATATINCPAVPNFTAPTATDNCDPSPVITFEDTTTPGTCVRAYTVTRTWIATDASGHVSDPVNQTIHVQDITPPVIVELPGPATIDCPATPSFAQATATDACDANVTLTFNDVTTPGSCLGNYSVTRTWTATDDCGNSSTASQTINVQDVTAPVIAELPGPTTTDCPATPSFAQAMATDACDSSVTLTFNDVTTPGSCPGNYSVTRTWTATDDCGNSSTASQTINVHDITPPVIAELPGPTTIDCPATPSFAQATATDACDSSVTLTFNDVTTPGSCPDNYSVTRTWTATDDCGNSSTASQTINVRDITPPVIVALPGPTIIDCPATPSFTQATATDACNANVALTFNDVTTPGSCPGNYSVTRTWTAMDDCGNSSTASQTINVRDITPPVIVELPGPTAIDCPATPSFALATATDACDASVALTFNDVTTPGSCLGNYSVTRTWTATDDCGNTSTASQTISVQDITAPVFDTLPGPTTIDCPATPSFTQATATDACDASVTLTFNDVTTPGSCAGNYSVTRTWTATDDCGNSSTASQTITVRDIVGPVLTGVPVDTTVECGPIPAAATPTASDACGSTANVTLSEVNTQDGDPTLIGHYNYTITRTWTATDACGNSTIAMQVITFIDHTSPRITHCAGNLTAVADANNHAKVPDFTALIADADVEDCSDVILSQSPPLNSLVGPGVTTVTLTFTDRSGNHSECYPKFTVTALQSNYAPKLKVTKGGGDEDDDNDNDVSRASINEGRRLRLQLIGTDTDAGQRLTYSISAGVQADMSLDMNTGRFSWTPSESHGPGTYPVVFRVTDNGSPALHSEKTVTITVKEVNHPPKFDNIDNRTIRRGQTLNLTLSATDRDQPANTLTFSIRSGSRNGMSLTGSAFKWVVPSNQPTGDYFVTFRVTDGASGSDETTIRITVIR